MPTNSDDTPGGDASNHPSSHPDESGVYTLTLAKEDFKFAAAHFTLFGPDHAELLHGHNYHVAVELVGRHLDDEGMLASFVDTKKAIRAVCASLDDRTLIPTASPHLRISEQDDHIEVRFLERRYVMPAADVLLLDEVNTSIEVLARRVWRELVSKLDLSALTSLGVSVSETAGQSCWFRAPIPRA